jgi:cell shape-determining protein MreC
MSRVAPTSGSKLLYFFFVCLSGLFLYIDLNYKSFAGIKFFYKSLSISSSFILKNATVEPLKYLYEVSKDKTELINENKRLKQELDKSYISSFIISRDSKFFIDDDSIRNFLELNNIKKVYHLAKLQYFDTEMYMCCSKHRAFIQTIKNNKSHIGSAVINARGSGKPHIIKCFYDKKVWQEKVSIGQEFYTSGMGGIYPVNILIGRVQEIREIDDNLIEFDINLVSSPLSSNVVGIIEAIR